LIVADGERDLDEVGCGSKTSIAVAASIPIRKIASLWYVSGCA